MRLESWGEMMKMMMNTICSWRWWKWDENKIQSTRQVCLKKSQSSSVNLKYIHLHVNNWSILTTVCTAERSTSVKLSVLFSCMRFKKLQLFVEMCSMWINHSTFQFHVSSATLYYWNRNFCGEMREKLEEVNKCFACSHQRRRWKHRKM